MEVEEYLPTLLLEEGKPRIDVADALRQLKSKVEPSERESYGVFEAEVKARLAGATTMTGLYWPLHWL